MTEPLRRRFNRLLMAIFPFGMYEYTVNIDGYEGRGPTQEIAEARAYRARCKAEHV